MGSPCTGARGESMITRPQRATASVPVVSAALSGRPETDESENRSRTKSMRSGRGRSMPTSFETVSRASAATSKMKGASARSASSCSRSQTPRCLSSSTKTRGSRACATLGQLGQRCAFARFTEQRVRQDGFGAVALAEINRQPCALQSQTRRVELRVLKQFCRALRINFCDRVGHAFDRAAQAEIEGRDRSAHAARDRQRAECQQIPFHCKRPSA